MTHDHRSTGVEDKRDSATIHKEGASTILTRTMDYVDPKVNRKDNDLPPLSTGIGKVYRKNHTVSEDKNILKTIQPESHTPKHRTVLATDRTFDLSKLVVHVEGMPWKVNYYQQVIDDHDPVRGQNLGKSQAFQQYHFIEEMILKVSSPLSSSQDPESKAFETRGTANTYPPMIPNVGDMFVADIGDGKLGLFSVKESERKSILKRATYEISYVLVDYLTNERLHDLESKVIKRSFFDVDFFESRLNPIIETNEYHTLKRLQAYAYDLSREYFDTCFSLRYESLGVLNSSGQFIYDHFLTKAVSNWIDSTISLKRGRLVVQNVEGLSIMKSKSIFDLMVERHGLTDEQVFRNVSVSSTRIFQKIPPALPLTYSEIKHLIIPKPNFRTFDQMHDKYKEIRIPSTSYPVQEERDYEVIDDHPLIYPLSLEESYIFSEAFYQDLDDKSHLEIQVYKYLKNRLLDINILNKLVESYHTWGLNERIYYTPFLIVLLNAYVKEFR